jgi:hypothetical protein
MSSHNNEFELQKPLHKRNDTVVFDLDGTIAMPMKNAKHHKVRHEGFAAEALDAGVNQKMVKKMHEAKSDGKNVVIMTARSGHYRDETKKWLSKNQIPHDALIMRPTDNTSKDKTVKRNLLEEDVLPKFNVEKAYDDKAKNRKMFDKLGIEAKGVK